jgi:hypothetical protein
MVAPTALRAQQATTAPQGPPDIAVVKFAWRKERVPGWEKNQFGPSFESYDAMRERVANERRIQQARNAGNKAEAVRREGAARMLEDAKIPKGSKNAERPRDGYRYKLHIRNIGAKTIKLVDWDYVFLGTADGGEIARNQFTSKEKIKPGGEKELSVFTLSPPSRAVSASALSKNGQSPFNEKVVVVRVVYTDGSVWELR